MESEVRMKFLGIRALHDAPASGNTLYGGNTSCIVLEDEEQIFLINAGFGINHFGDQLIQRTQASKKTISCHVFLSDFLWDNMMGLPMFTPIHFKSSQIQIHSALVENDAKKWFSGICSRDFSPFEGVASFRSQLSFAAATAERTIGNWRIQLFQHEHPMAPYAAAVWVFEHCSGARIAFLNNATKNSDARTQLVQQIGPCSYVVQSAIAPTLNHPTMGGRLTFNEALTLGADLKAQHTFITGIHPMLTDRDLIHAEVEITKTTGLKPGVQFSIAREWATIEIPVNGNQKKAG